MNWPIGCGRDFKGVYDRVQHEILAFSEFHSGQKRIQAEACDLSDTEYLDKLIGVLTVQKKDGTRVTYDGTNASEMVGFYVVRNATNREPFSDRNYLAPIGQQQIDDYGQRGYTLSQTYGW